MTFKDRRKTLGIRQTALIEIVVYLGVMLALDYFIFGGDRFRDVSPHPFWPLVLLLSAQYGTAEGLLAAAAATLALLLGGVPQQTITEDMYQHLFGIVKNPLLWSVSAVVLGEVRMRHVREAQHLEIGMENTSAKTADLSKAYERLQAVRSSLESRIAGQIRTGMTMYQAMRALDRTDPNEVLMGVAETVNAVMNPEKFSVYLLSDDAMEIVLGQGWAQDDSYSRSFRSNSLLFKEIVGRQRFLCAVNEDDQKVLGPEGLLAGPLMDDKTGDIVGMLKIEKLGFMDLHFSNVQTFRVLCDWIAHSYSAAVRYQTAQSEALVNTETRVMTHTFFERQRDFLIRLGQRVGFDISMVLIRLENAEQIGRERASILPIALREVSRVELRGTDLLFEHQSEAHQYCVMLPNTSSERASIVARKLVEGLTRETKDTLRDARFSTTIQEIYRKPPVDSVR